MKDVRKFAKDRCISTTITLKLLLKNPLVTSPNVPPSPAPPAYQLTSNLVMSQAVNLTQST